MTKPQRQQLWRMGSLPTVGPPLGSATTYADEVDQDDDVIERVGEVYLGLYGLHKARVEAKRGPSPAAYL